MSPTLTEHILEKLAVQPLERVSGLLLIVAPSGGKTQALQDVAAQLELPLLNVGLVVSQALLELPVNRRSAETRPLLEKLVDSWSKPTVLLDNLEILFEKSLRHDPLRLLEMLARQHQIVAAWPGEIRDDKLIYALGHLEAYERRLSDLNAELIIA